MRIDQCLPDFAKHDAIGNHVLHARRVLRQAGFESDIWADRIDERLAGEARHYKEYAGGAGDVLVYQLSTDSDMVPWLLDRAESGTRLFSNYHNITPAAFFRRWEPDIARRLDVARRQMAELAPATELAVGVSHFNRGELDRAGYRHTSVAPLMLDLRDLQASRQGSHGPTGERAGRGSRWLFVGRIAPNKCQHDVVASFAVYRRVFDPHATLTLVGSPSSYRYLRAVRRLAADLDLGQSFEHRENIRLDQLVDCYRKADVLVCLSEHEGFCAPLIEAMDMSVPVVAYSAAAVPETLAGAGVLLDDKDPFAVASAVADLLSDPGRREGLVRRGASRAAELSIGATSGVFLQVLTVWLEGRPQEHQ